MIESQVAKKYATALLALGKEHDVLMQLGSEFEQLGQVLEASPELMNLLTSPQILDSEKEETLRKVFEGRISKYLLEFLAFLIEKNRIEFLPAIGRTFRHLVEDEMGIVRATVTTAVSVSPEALDRLKVRLEELTAKKVLMEHVVDSAIIGGAFVMLHNRIIDRSVRSQLRLLKDRLRTLRVH